MDAINIENATLNNTWYRKELFTVAGSMQVVVMSLAPGEDIPLETHAGSQFIRVESGKGVAKTADTKSYLKDGSSVLIHPGVSHFVKNTSETHHLKLYAIYTPPEHAVGARQKRQN